jgi:hypothetical protein
MTMPVATLSDEGILNIAAYAGPLAPWPTARLRRAEP